MTTETDAGRIYRQHEIAFKDTAAYVVTDKNGELLARVAFKFARSGLRTTCYLHILGAPMVKSFAAGGGYDKASASVHAAARKTDISPSIHPRHDVARQIRDAIKDEGRHWDDDLRAAGFNVLQAV